MISSKDNRQSLSPTGRTVILVINVILPTRTEIDRVAWTIADGGINAVSPAVLRELGFQARGVGVLPVLTEILLDRSAPPVARQRAFGRIASALGRRRTRDSDPCTEPCAA